MPKKQLKRINKSKKEIVSSIQLTQDAERRRALIRDVIFPYLLELNDTIGYSKIFLQSFAGLVEGVLEKRRKVITVGSISTDITTRLTEIFSSSDPQQKKELERYSKLVELLKDISVQDIAYAAELPRYIDGYLMKDKNKETISLVPINEILG